MSTSLVLLLYDLPQPDEKRWVPQAVDERGQAHALPKTSPLELLLALDGGSPKDRGAASSEKNKDFIINNYYHKVIERSSLLSNAQITPKLKHV